MMRNLICHPDRPCGITLTVSADAVRSLSDDLELHYVLAGRTGAVRLPPASTPTRSDELWRHTCFETFLRVPSGEAYYEFNFAPSTQWAAYRFHAYRAGMERADWIAPPRCEARADNGVYELRVFLNLGEAKGLSPGVPWRVGLSAVIEDASGRISYWALSHSQGRPDFHHSDCFALELPKP